MLWPPQFASAFGDMRSHASTVNARTPGSTKAGVAALFTSDLVFAQMQVSARLPVAMSAHPSVIVASPSRVIVSVALRASGPAVRDDPVRGGAPCRGAC